MVGKRITGIAIALIAGCAADSGTTDEAMDGAATVGTICYDDASCASGSCIADADLGYAYCTTACATDADCAAPTVCDGQSCMRVPPLQVTAGCSASGPGFETTFWVALIVAELLRRKLEPKHDLDV